MGEEEKKLEEAKEAGDKKEAAVEETKKEEEKPEKEEKKPDEKKEEDGGEKKEEAPPAPPEEIIMKVYMHCEGCAKKVQRSLKNFQGVENVIPDCKTHTVVVKGKVAAADPLKVVDRVQKKIGRKVELLTPIPPKPEKEEEKKEDEKPKPEEKKEEPQVVTVVLKVHMHCDACCQEIKKRILKMKGVQSVEADLKASEAAVKGVFDPHKLVEYVYKRTGKHAMVIKQDPPEKKPEDKEKGEEKAKGDGGDDKKEGAEDKKAEEEGGEENKDGEGKEEKKEGTAAEFAAEAMASKSVEVKRNELYYYYPRNELNYSYSYPPQIFSDENPNACSVM